MSMAIAHFAVGVAGGILLLIFFPHMFKDVIKNDVFIIFLSGFIAMLPDLAKLGIKFFQNIHDKAISNIFWFHNLIDKWDITDSVNKAIVLIAIACIMFFIYYNKIKGGA